MLIKLENDRLPVGHDLRGGWYSSLLWTFSKRLRHSRINKSAPHQRRVSDLRRQPIADFVHLRRDGELRS
jgi:hypothetical protein